ncbi:hypothetical protein EDB83DRAFT_2531709 [Lactarius deliciosus]|nr:hypothetical protein EDB83DRAFT_2531709 [Lactarius deliciosus]
MVVVAVQGAPQTPTFYARLFQGSCKFSSQRPQSCIRFVAAPNTESEEWFADVNAFLTFAATRHTYTPEHLRSHPRVAQILEAAKAGHVPVQLVSNLSEKNPLVELAHDASVFSSGAHRVLVKSPAGSSESHLGMISDLRLSRYSALSLVHPALQCRPLPKIQHSSTFLHYVSNPLGVAVHSRKSVLDAMQMMSNLGVSSVAVLEEESANLLSAISVTDIGQDDGRVVTKQPYFDDACSSSSFHRSSCDQDPPRLDGRG